MEANIKQSVREQFGKAAAYYVHSAIHARGADLARLRELAALTGVERVLDIATGTGHTAFAMADGALEVIGMDLTPSMIMEARRVSAEKGTANVRFMEGDAERIPFPDARFDLVTCRIAAHHFPHVTAFCAEVFRVLRPGGTFLLVDNVSPEVDDQDRFINAIDRLRDPSHVRAWKVSEWERMLTDAGFDFSLEWLFTTDIPLERWMAGMTAPEEIRAEVRRRLAEAPPAFKETFAITPYSFVLYKALVVARKRAGE